MYFPPFTAKLDSSTHLHQLNLRIPSMLIRRDGLMAKPYPTGPNFEKLLSGKNAAAPVDPARLQQAIQLEQMQRRKQEIAKEVGSGSNIEDWMYKPHFVMRQYAPTQSLY